MYWAYQQIVPEMGEWFRYKFTSTPRVTKEDPVSTNILNIVVD